MEYMQIVKVYSKVCTFAVHSSKSAFANIMSYTNPVPLVHEKSGGSDPHRSGGCACDWNTA